MRLELIGAPFTYKWPHGAIRFESGQVIDVPEDRALRIMVKAPGRLRPVQSTEPSVTPPRDGLLIPPIQSGWIVTYEDRHRKLCGGVVDRVRGTVQDCRREAGRWMVRLTDGQQIFLERIKAVGQSDAQGRLLAAWEVKRHGFNGEKAK